MAITNAQAREKWLGPIRDAYAKALVFRQLTNRRFEGDAQDAYELTLNTTQTAFSVSRTDRSTNRAPNLPAAQTSSSVQDTLTMDKHVAISVYERNLDLLEAGPDKMPVIMRDAAYDLAEDVDTQVRDTILAGVPAANDGVTTAGTYRLGDGTNFVSAAGEPATEAARKYINQVIRQTGSIYRANNYWKLGDSRYDERQPYMIISNALANAMNVYIDEEKPSEALVNSFTRSDGVSVGGVFGVWKDIPLLVTNGLPLVPIGGKNYHQILVTNPAATTAAFRSPDTAFDQGAIWVNVGGTPTKLMGWSMDTEAVFGLTVVNSGLLMRWAVRAEA